MVNQCVKFCITKHVVCLEKLNFQRGSCETILDRWHRDADFEKSLSAEVGHENSRVHRTRSGRPPLCSKGDDGKGIGKLY